MAHELAQVGARRASPDPRRLFVLASGELTAALNAQRRKGTLLAGGEA